ncbi:MAG: thioesterase [Bacillota bacterium]|nr:thioesterase [Bacillota bacterium]
MIVEKEFYIGYKDINKDLKIKNMALLVLFENIEGIHANMAGDGLRETISVTHAAWLLLSWKIKVLRRPEYAQTVKVRTWLTEIKRVYSYREFEIRSETGELLVVASSKWVRVSTDKGTPIRVPNEVAERYGIENMTHFDDNETKLEEPEKHISALLHDVNYEWIDMNRHMNNTYYMTLAEMAFPENIRGTLSDNFEIMYKKEIKAGKKVKCLFSEDETAYTVIVKSMDLSVLHAIIKFYK